VNTLEARAKAYTPLSFEELLAEKVGDGTFGDEFEAGTDWADAVDLYRFELDGAIALLEGDPPPHTPGADAIMSAVNGAAAARDGFLEGRNAIARGGDDAWGVWIREGDTTLRYWLPEGGTPVPVDTRAAFLGAYDGTATYSGAVDGYGHYTDS